MVQGYQNVCNLYMDLRTRDEVSHFSPNVGVPVLLGSVKSLKCSSPLFHLSELPGIVKLVLSELSPHWPPIGQWSKYLLKQCVPKYRDLKPKLLY